MKHNKRSYRKGNPRGTKSKFNGRRFRRYDRAGIQRHAIRLYEKENLHPEIIAQMLGISIRSIYRWISWFKSKGWDAFQLPKPQRRCKLNEQQLGEIVLLVLTHTPQALGYETTLWTRKIISEEILKKFGISLSEVSVGKILKRNKVTPQKPIRRAYQQSKQAVEEFRTVTFPSLVQKAKEEGALIVWLDETQARSDANIGRTWGKRVDTPIIPANGANPRINVIGSIDQNGCTDFMTYQGNTDSSVVITFIDMLVRKKKEKIYLILDNAGYHKSAELKDHIKEHHAEALKFVYLPPYSPELNPAELIWSHLKSHGLNRIITKTKGIFIETVELHLRKFTGNYHLGKRLFGKKELAFITDNMPDLLAA